MVGIETEDVNRVPLRVPTGNSVIPKNQVDGAGVLVYLCRSRSGDSASCGNTLHSRGLGSIIEPSRLHVVSAPVLMAKIGISDKNIRT